MNKQREEKRRDEWDAGPHLFQTYRHLRATLEKETWGQKKLPAIRNPPPPLPPPPPSLQELHSIITSLIMPHLTQHYRCIMGSEGGGRGDAEPHEYLIKHETTKRRSSGDMESHQYYITAPRGGSWLSLLLTVFSLFHGDSLKFVQIKSLTERRVHLYPQSTSHCCVCHQKTTEEEFLVKLSVMMSLSGFIQQSVFYKINQNLCC